MFSDFHASDVYAASSRLAPVVRRTPLRRAPELSRIAGGDIHLKLENEQITGSFKVRGAYNALLTLTEEERARGVVTSSAGNHGLGLAYAARALNVPARIYVPRSAPHVKVHGIRALGAEVDDSQADYDAAMVAAKRDAEERGARYINPCLGATLLAGQGTVALEILEDMPDLATLVVPVGGGGLLGGSASLLRKVAPHVRIFGAQSEHTAAMARSLEAGHVVEVPSMDTVADGLAGQIDEEALEIAKHSLDGMVVLSEREIGEAVAWLHGHGITAEGSGAAGVAAVLHRRLGELPVPAAVIVSGGNIDPERLETLLREHRHGA